MPSPPPPGVSLGAIKRLRCPRCRARMKLISVSPGPAGHDQRRFECPKCDHAETRVAASDPMKSRAAGWLRGDLKRPE